MLLEIAARVAPETEIEEIEVRGVSLAERLRFQGSPTIRTDAVVVEPGSADPGDHTPRCRLHRTDAGLVGLSDPAWIEAALGR